MRLVAAVLAGALALFSAGPGEAVTTAERAPSAFVSDRLSVEALGHGPDLILIPGFASSREVWRREAERLRTSHRVHLVQLAGFAGEPWSHGEGPFVEPMLAEVARYVRENGLKQPAIIGHSMGGMTAVMLAQRHPELVGRVMSVDSLPFFSTLLAPTATVETARPFAERTAATLLSMDEAAFRASQMQTAVTMARNEEARAAMVEWSLASDRAAIAAAMRDVMTTDLRPGLSAMTTPVWILYAADADGGPAASMVDALWTREYSGLAGARLLRVDDSRHFIMADQPDRFSAIVDQFLAE